MWRCFTKSGATPLDWLIVDQLGSRGPSSISTWSLVLVALCEPHIWSNDTDSLSFVLSLHLNTNFVISPGYMVFVLVFLNQTNHIHKIADFSYNKFENIVISIVSLSYLLVCTEK